MSKALKGRDPADPVSTEAQGKKSSLTHELFGFKVVGEKREDKGGVLEFKCDRAHRNET